MCKDQLVQLICDVEKLQVGSYLGKLGTNEEAFRGIVDGPTSLPVDSPIFPSTVSSSRTHPSPSTSFRALSVISTSLEVTESRGHFMASIITVVCIMSHTGSALGVKS